MGVSRRRDCHVRRDVVETEVVVCVGDGEVHVVCVWRYINERWCRYLNNNQLNGTTPSELVNLTNLQRLYVLFTSPSFHIAHSRALSFLSCTQCPFDVLFFFSPGFFVPLIVLVSTFLSSA